MDNLLFDSSATLLSSTLPTFGQLMSFCSF